MTTFAARLRSSSRSARLGIPRPEDAHRHRPFDVALCARTRQDAMNSDRSLGSTLMMFRIRTWASRPCAHRPYTVAVVTPKCSATCLIESNRSGAPWLAQSVDPGPPFPRHKPDTKSLLIGASVGTGWDSASERFSRLSPTCKALLPLPTLAPDLPKLNVVGSNPISRSRKARFDGHLLGRPGHLFSATVAFTPLFTPRPDLRVLPVPRLRPRMPRTFPLHRPVVPGVALDKVPTSEIEGEEATAANRAVACPPEARSNIPTCQ